MSAAETMSRAIYFDGLSNKKHAVTLRFAGSLEICAGDEILARWAFDDMRRADGPQNVLRLRNVAAASLARLEIRDAADRAAVLEHCGALARNDRDDVATGRIVFWSVAAAASILAVIWFGVPFMADRLAPLVPPWLETRIGDVADKQMHALFVDKSCARPEGVAALNKLVAELEGAADLKNPPHPAVLASSVPNAFALPGGKIYVLNGLIARAKDADEVAGVIAHELGHVAHRDGLRRLIQNGGSSFLVGLLFGDVTGSGVMLTTGRSLLSAAYSRDAEANADLYSKHVMERLGRPPKALGDLLLRITGPESDDPLAIFASHPMTAERQASLQQATVAIAGPPLLTNTEWHALKAICREPRGDDNRRSDTRK